MTWSGNSHHTTSWFPKSRREEKKRVEETHSGSLCVAARKFRMFTIRALLRCVREGDWFTSLDLKDAYFHIPVRQAHRRFLHFFDPFALSQFRVCRTVTALSTMRLLGLIPWFPWVCSLWADSSGGLLTNGSQATQAQDAPHTPSVSPDLGHWEPPPHTSRGFPWAE